LQIAAELSHSPQLWKSQGWLGLRNFNSRDPSIAPLAAELTNRLIAGAVLTPRMVGTLLELQRGGFNYAKWAHAMRVAPAARCHLGTALMGKCH
jgi:hypothetical protein